MIVLKSLLFVIHLDVSYVTTYSSQAYNDSSDLNHSVFGDSPLTLDYLCIGLVAFTGTIHRYVLNKKYIQATALYKFGTDF